MTDVQIPDRTTIRPPVKRTLRLDEIQPYWRNPRRIPPEAVAQVKSSIEKYGYQQAIVVDQQNVIVVGHTRLLALQQIYKPADRIEVYVTDLPAAKAKEYRLADNKLGELSQWDPSALVMELREFESALLEEFFPNVDLEISMIEDAAVTLNDVEKATEKVENAKEVKVFGTTRVECPACLEKFEVRTDSLPGGDSVAIGVESGGPAKE